MLLALDTAAELCAACLWADGRERGRAVERMRTGHAERLMAVIEAALGEAGAGYSDVSGIAVSIGPGSFTGIRVGVATARGLALGLGRPSVGVSTLEAIAASVDGGDRPVMVALEGGRGAIHAAVFDAGGAVLHPPASLDLAEAAGWAEALSPVLAGNAAPRLAEVLPLPVLATEPTADIAVFARLGAERLGTGATEKPRPLYIRPPDAKPQTGGILRQSP